MLSLPGPLRVFLCTQPIDLRLGFDRLAALARQHLHLEPLAGHLFVFKNRRGDRLKILYWDKDGFALWYKRLERGVFTFPGSGPERQVIGSSGLEVSSVDLLLLLDGIEVEAVTRQTRYRLSE